MDLFKVGLRSLYFLFISGLIISLIVYVGSPILPELFSLNATHLLTVPDNNSFTTTLDQSQAQMDPTSEDHEFVPQSSLETYDPFSLEVPLPFLPNYKTPCFRNEFSKLYCLPYFFFLVSQKSGTTDLFYGLTTHPKIIENEKKEYHWWNRGRFPLNIRIPNNLTFAQYMDRYNTTTVKIQHSTVRNSAPSSRNYHPKILGDYSASYLYDQLQWKRYPQNAGLQKPKVISAHAIYHLLPEAKFVVILRDPSERTFSDYCYYNRVKRAKEFHSKVLQGIAWFNTCLSNGNGSCLYDVPDYVKTTTNWHPDRKWDPVVRLRASLYSEFLEDWFKVFDRKQFYIFRFEDYIKDRLYYLNEIFQFLGIKKLSSFADADALPKRRTPFKLDFRNDTKEILDKFYEPYNKKLAKMLNDDRYLWNDT